MDGLQRYNLERKCELENIDIQLIDNKLTYNENLINLDIRKNERSNPKDAYEELIRRRDEQIKLLSKENQNLKTFIKRNL